MKIRLGFATEPKAARRRSIASSRLLSYRLTPRFAACTSEEPIRGSPRQLIPITAIVTVPVVLRL